MDTSIVEYYSPSEKWGTVINKTYEKADGSL